MKVNLIYILLFICFGVVYNLYKDIRLLQKHNIELQELVSKLQYNDTQIEDKILIMKSTAWKYYFTHKNK